MSDIATVILEWLNANPQLAGLATFIISAAESIAIIGTIVPGSVMMTAIGALVGAGIIPFWETLFWATLGAIAGDGISYWLGHYFKDRIHEIWPFRKHPNILASGEVFFHKHGAMSVFIGRFVGPVRALVPLVAGMLNMKPMRFLIANVTSAILWAPIYMLPGFILGAASMELPSELAARVIMLVLFVALFIALFFWLIKKIFELITQEVDQFLNWIWNSLKKSRYFHIITSLLKHHNPKKTHGQLALAFYFILTCIAFLYLANLILYKGSDIGANTMIYHFFRSLRTPELDNIMILVSLLGEKYVLLPTMVAVAAWLAYKKYWRAAIHLFLLGTLAAGSIEAFKHIVHSARPWGILGNGDAGHSFPSGHTTLSLVFFVSFALFLTKIAGLTYKKTVYTLTAILVGSIAISRLYLGAHWLTDIIGGLLLGTAIILLVTLSYHRKLETIAEKRSIIIAVIVALFFSYTINLGLSFNKLKHHYTTLEWPIYTITFDSWWQQQGDYFPLTRVNRVGLPKNLFNVQWLGKLSDIKTSLENNGWETPPKHDWLSALYRITAIDSTQYLPLVSPLYLDKHPAIILIKPDTKNKKLLIIRFWSSPFLINNVEESLWLGTIEYAPSTYSWLLKSKHRKDVSPKTSLLFSEPPKTYDIKETTVTIQIDKHNKNQNILLIKPKKIVGSNEHFDYPKRSIVSTQPNATIPNRHRFEEYGVLS